MKKTMTAAAVAPVAPAAHKIPAAPAPAPVANEHGPVVSVSPAAAAVEPVTAADMVTPSGDGLPLPAETVKTLTETEKAAARKAAARKAAREKVIAEYAGNPAGLLTARVVEYDKTRRDGSAVYRVVDYRFSWADENGTTVTGSGKIPVTALLTKPARDNIAAAVAGIYRVAAAAAHTGYTNETTAPAREYFSRIMDIIGIPETKRAAVADDARRVVSAAYYPNNNGDDDINPVMAAIEAIGRRIAIGRAANNAYNDRLNAKRAAETKKAAEKAPAVPGTVIK